MGDRRNARELALQALYYFDVVKNDSTDSLEMFKANFDDLLNEKVNAFFLDLVEGVIENKKKLDDLLEKYSKNWKISRMPVVDRNIMRIATYEMLKCPDIPASVTINEAVEIGKKYGTKDSGSFINGVLDRIHCLEKIENPK